VRDVQRHRILNQQSPANQNHSEGPNPRQSHPASFLSTMEFLPHVCPGAAHFLLIGQSERNLLVPAANRTASCLQPARAVAFLQRSGTSTSSYAVIAYFYNNRIVLRQFPVAWECLFLGGCLDYTAHSAPCNRKTAKNERLEHLSNRFEASCCQQSLPIPARPCHADLLVGCSVDLPVHAHSAPMGEML
jgi:hypothetical protein